MNVPNGRKAKSSEVSGSRGGGGAHFRHRSRYKLPALQILMLQEYPALWSKGGNKEEDGTGGQEGPAESTFRVLMYSTE